MKETSKNHIPTTEFYTLFQFIYDYLNDMLFGAELPNCMIVITRKRNTFGYFIAGRWRNDESVRTDEIAINPTYFDRHPLVEMLQTITHEMCHLWQYHYGEKKSMRTYHNMEWSEKMESIGLMPSDTGIAGGKRVGMRMMDYPLKGGGFISVVNELIQHESFKHLWFDRFKKNDNAASFSQNHNFYQDLGLENTLTEIHQSDDYVLSVSDKKKVKTKYYCPLCQVNVWGKPHLILKCGCSENYVSFIENPIKQSIDANG